MKDSSMCSIIDSIRYGLMGSLQFHEMGMYGFRALFTHETVHGNFLSVEPQEDS